MVSVTTKPSYLHDIERCGCSSGHYYYYYYLFIAGSGWIINELSCVHLNITKYAPMEVGKYMAIPKKLRTKRCLINIHNNDNKCLMWCALAARYPCASIDNPSRTDYYEQFQNEIDDSGISWPITPSQIPTFEKKNM